MALSDRLRLTLGTQVLLALVAGLVVGLFFGEYVAFLKDIGRAFVLLLQMTVLPYIMLSLITGLGQLTYTDVKQLVLKAGAVLVFSWGLAIAVILAIPLAFPVWESASFFSTSLVEEPEKINYLNLFIPSNPFYSLANNVVPAVVLFSIALGLALIGIEDKDSLLGHLHILNRAMMSVTRFVSKLMPIGVLAIVASAAGTMGLADLERLQIYLLTYSAMALLLTLWVLPAMITSFTPLTYRQVVGQTRDILITAFATGSAFIVLPLLIERSQQLLRESELGTEATDATVEVIVPAFTSFPKIGTLLPMSFVLFAGWFSGATVPVTQYPTFVLTGVVGFFGSVNMAMPMLMDLLRVPVDLFQLYLAINIVTSRFAVLMSTMNIIVLTTVGTCAVTGFLTPRWSRIVRQTVVTLMLGVVVIVGLRMFFNLAISNTYEKDQVIAGMQIVREPYPATVYTEPPHPLPPLSPSPPSRLTRMQERGAIRVGYRSELMPFAYVNAAGELVGFDIEMAYALARDLKVKLELVPIDVGQWVEQLNAGYCDLVMSGTPITPRLAQAVAFSTPYLDATVAFIVKDHRREEFNSRSAVRRLQGKGLRIAVPDVPYYVAKVQSYLPKAEIVIIPSITSFFEQDGEAFDALVYSAESGSAWTLLYPAYTVAVPHPDILAAPIAYVMARGDQEMVDLVNHWLVLKQKDQTIQSLYDYWVLGQNAVPQEPRWSIMRNVLQWVE